MERKVFCFTVIYSFCPVESIRIDVAPCDSVHNIKTTLSMFNPLVTNGLSHPYHLDEFTLIFRDIRIDVLF